MDVKLSDSLLQQSNNVVATSNNLLLALQDSPITQICISFSDSMYVIKPTNRDCRKIYTDVIKQIAAQMQVEAKSYADQAAIEKINETTITAATADASAIPDTSNN